MQEENKRDNLSAAVGKELLTPTLDLSIDYSEVALDNLIFDGVLKEIPFVKSVLAITKTGVLIKEKWFLKKILTFIQEFNSNKIEENKLEEFKKKFENDTAYRNKIVDEIMIMNDSFKDVSKSKISANLFKAYVENHFDWNYLHSLLISLDQLHPEGYIVLDKLSKKEFRLRSGESSPQSRDYNDLVHLMSSGLGYNTTGFDSTFKVTDMGIALYRFGIRQLVN